MATRVILSYATHATLNDFLQLILGTKVAEVIVLLPRMNIGHSSGEMLRQKAVQIWEEALTRMSEANPDPDQHLSLGMTFNLAQKLKGCRCFSTFAYRNCELDDL